MVSPCISIMCVRINQQIDLIAELFAFRLRTLLDRFCNFGESP